MTKGRQTKWKHYTWATILSVPISSCQESHIETEQLQRGKLYVSQYKHVTFNLIIHLHTNITLASFKLFTYAISNLSIHTRRKLKVQDNHISACRWTRGVHCCKVLILIANALSVYRIQSIGAINAWWHQ